MRQYLLDLNQYKRLARQAAAEGCVLLVNEKEALPIKKGESVSVFGRSQMNYYKSGTGSGGLVNVDYVVGITEGLLLCDDISVNAELLKMYEEWVKENPFDAGKGWAQEPWFQQEMILKEEVVRNASQKTDMALVVIGRTAGEDRDNSAAEGSYYLTEAERKMIEIVRRYFSRMIIVLNVGNIIDMKWVNEYKPDAVMLVWQGGQEGGNGVADVLTGKVNPCGKLTDTIANDISDYPSEANFGNEYENIYAEDIYVGYRYFESVARERVRYPFGYGLSYTKFHIKTKFLDDISIDSAITNIGKAAGREVVQVYVEAPQGKLGKAARVLVDFGKTGLLKPEEREILHFKINIQKLASYDDSGCTGYKSCYVLEAGEYKFYVGTDVRTAELAGSYFIKETIVVEELQEALAPTARFERLKAVAGDDGNLLAEREPVPVRTVNLSQRMKENRPKDYSYTGNKGLPLSDVLNGKVTMEDFLAQLSNEELACLVRGEGMCSPKVTPGTAAAYGGVTENLKQFGIPIACCSDGPSGIRFDSGTKAFSLPNGTLLASTFDRRLNEDLFEMVGIELGKHRVEALLGPAANIHRHPLNGRNFEYFSEDPFLSGQIAAAQLRGMRKQGTDGVLKHFCANNQEFHRRSCNAVVSERALREIYLKSFEIAVKEGGARYIMTSYNPVNGIWSASNYDLNTTVLREEWGFKGIVMTDWWAEMNEEGQEAARQNTAFMIRAQNDLYMVVEESEGNSLRDNTLEYIKTGIITRGELQRSAANICRILMDSNTMERFMAPITNSKTVIDEETTGTLYAEDIRYYDIYDGCVIGLADIATTKGASSVVGIHVLKNGEYKVVLKARSELGELAQIPLTIYLGGYPALSFTMNGTEGKWIEKEKNMILFGKNNYLRFYFGQSGMEIQEIRFHLIKEFTKF